MLAAYTEEHYFTYFTKLFQLVLGHQPVYLLTQGSLN